MATTRKTTLGRAMKASRTLRTALSEQLTYVASSKMIKRLNNTMMRAFQPANDRLCGLRGFEFNENRNLSYAIHARCFASIDRMAGQLKLVTSGFDPRIKIEIPKAATHFKLYTVALEIDFDSRQYVTSIQQTPLVRRNSSFIDTITQVHSVTPNSRKTLLLLQGIAFCLVLNGRQYPLYTGNALGIVEVSAPV